MFGSIGPQEILIVLVIALVVLGPKKLPEMARSLGKGVKEFKEGINDDDTVDVTADEEDDDEPVSSRVHELPPAELPPAAEAPEPVAVAEPVAAPAAASDTSRGRLLAPLRDPLPRSGWRASAGSITARRRHSSSTSRSCAIA